MRLGAGVLPGVDPSIEMSAFVQSEPTPVPALIRVFVSSTWLDLQPEREMVERTLQRLPETKFVGMEYFGSQNETTAEASLTELDDCHLYVGIIGGRYGSGITEQEYRRARARRLPCLIYLKSEHSIVPAHRDAEVEGQDRRRALLEELRKHHTLSEFTAPAELAENLLADLHRFLFRTYISPRLARESESTRPTPESTRLEAAIQNLNADYENRLQHAGVTTAQARRSIAVGGDVTRSILVTGDRNTVFVGAYQRLADLYRGPESVLDRRDLDRFTGREWLTRKIDQFLEAQSRGCIIIEADAGLGKTAYLAHLSRTRGYIHHFIGIDTSDQGIGTGLMNLAAQLVLAWDIQPFYDNAALPAAAGKADFLQVLLQRAAARRNELRPGEKIVLVVDALDEAPESTHPNVMGLPRILPEGVYLIVSQRPVAVRLSVDAEMKPLRILPGDASNKDDMRAYLHGAAQWEKISAALQRGGYSSDDFVGTLEAKSEGVWIYLHYVLDEIERGTRKLLNLEALPANLWRYYARHWREHQKDDDWTSVQLPLLSTLAALEVDPSAGFLCELAGVPASNRVRSLLAQDWQPFLKLGSEAGRHGFYHTSLRDFFMAELMLTNCLTKTEGL